MKRRTNRVNMTDVVSVWMKLSGWTVDIVCVRLCVTLNRVCQEDISQFTSVVIQRIVNIKIFSLSWVFDHTKNTILPCHPELSIRVCLDSWTRENRKFCYNRQTSCILTRTDSPTSNFMNREHSKLTDFQPYLHLFKRLSIWRDPKMLRL